MERARIIVGAEITVANVTSLVARGLSGADAGQSFRLGNAPSSWRKRPSVDRYRDSAKSLPLDPFRNLFRE